MRNMAAMSVHKATDTNTQRLKRPLKNSVVRQKSIDVSTNVLPPSSVQNGKPRKKEAKGLFLAGFLLGLLFEPEDGGEKFLRNIGGVPPNYTALQQRSTYSPLSPL
jgi:hypothetical protein